MLPIIDHIHLNYKEFDLFEINYFFFFACCYFIGQHLDTVSYSLYAPTHTHTHTHTHKLQ